VKRLAGNGFRLAGLTLLALCVAGVPAAAKQPKGTNLLFTFVTNQAGFDTALTIANTTQDPFGTTLIDGTCTFYFYGESPPPPTAFDISAGTVFTTTASVVAPKMILGKTPMATMRMIRGTQAANSKRSTSWN